MRASLVRLTNEYGFCGEPTREQRMYVRMKKKPTSTGKPQRRQCLIENMNYPTFVENDQQNMLKM